MPRGPYPFDYLHTPATDGAPEKVYAAMDGWTNERFEDEPTARDSCEIVVPLPPVRYEGRFVKGMYFSQGVDYLLKLHPNLPLLFFSIANAQCAAYPWSKYADAYFTLYPNEHRERWYRATHPDHSRKYLIPLQDAEFTHEYIMAPVPVKSRDIDVLCVASFAAVKNLPFIAQALKIYRQKHPDRLIRMTLVTGKAFDQDLSGLDDSEKDIYRQIESILGNPHDYIDFAGLITHFDSMPKHYSRAKVFVLGSLQEGRNRAMNEAMCCNTPVICFEEFNYHIRGGSPVFPDGAGLYARFDPESLADTIHKAISTPKQFFPRKAYLTRWGRRNFLNTCMDAIPYYADAVLGYERGHGYSNLWLDLAIQQNYQVSLHDFLYGKLIGISHVRGIDAIGKAIESYCSRLGV